MSEMVDRVAEALWQHDSERALGKSRRVPWSDWAEEDKDRHRGRARAAIRAMREPTGDMAHEGNETGAVDNGVFHIMDSSIVTVWEAMIDEALK